MSWDFLTDDWKRIPQNTRYFFIFGVFLVLLTWIEDHWGAANTYTFFGWDFRKTFFSLGIATILFGFIPLIWKQWVYWSRAFKYRDLYPISELNSKFYLVWFAGKLMLFDFKKKKYYHVYPYETAQDLFFSETGFRFDYRFEDMPPNHKLRISNNIEISLNEYTDGGVINTRA